MRDEADDSYTHGESSGHPSSSKLPPELQPQQEEDTGTGERTNPASDDEENLNPEHPESKLPASCQECKIKTKTLAELSQLTTSLRRIETLLTRTAASLSADIDLDDLDEALDHSNNKSSTRPRRQDIPLLPAASGEYDPGPLSPHEQFWNIMGPGAEYNRMDRLRDEFIDFFSDEYGKLVWKECERLKRFPARYIDGALVDETLTDGEIIELMKNEWWPRGQGFDRLFDSPSKLQANVGGVNVTSVHVEFVRCNYAGFVEYAWGDDAVSSMFCTVTYNGLKTPKSTFNAMAVIMSSMTPANHKHRIGETPRPVLGAIKQFLECWPSKSLLTTSRFELGPFYSKGYVVLTFSLRSFSKRLPGWEENPVLRPCRVKGTLTGSIMLDEERWCLVLYTTVSRPSGVEPLFSLLTFSDNDYSKAPRIIDSGKRWPQLRLKPVVCHTGITAFQWLIMETLIEWTTKWESLLDLLDENSERQTGDVLSAEGRRVAMFDNENFDKSESYFATSQLLRIASGWIKHATSDLDALIGTYHSRYEHDYVWFLNEWDIQDKAERRQLKIVKENWKCVRSNLAMRSKFLLERIQRKEVEIDSLRNGLFNATSVAEAQKSSQLSHYILVFTVITIFYLPLSFISSLFALNMFDFQDPSTKTVFITTSATVGVITYLISFGLAWFVRKEERREMFKNFFPLPLPEFNPTTAHLLGTRQVNTPEHIERNDQRASGRKGKGKGKGKEKENNPNNDDDEQKDQDQGTSVLRERFHKQMDKVRSKFGKNGGDEMVWNEWDQNTNGQEDIEMGVW